MSNEIGAWLLVFVLPLFLAWAGTVAWKEVLVWFRGRVRIAIEDVNAQKKEIEATLRQAHNQLHAQKKQIEFLSAQTYPDTPELLEAVRGSERGERLELARSISVWRSIEARAAREKVAEFENRLRAMSTLWLDAASVENACTKLLCKNLWVLGPDLRNPRHVFRDQGQEKIISGYFPNDTFKPAPKFSGKTDYRPDVAGVFYRRTELTSDGRSEKTVFVIVEAKAPREIVSQSVMDEAFQYALNLRRMSKTLACWDIECYALAGRVDPRVRSQLFRIGQTHHTISVTPITWSALLERARHLNPAFVDLDPFEPNGVAPSYVSSSGPATETVDEPTHSEDRAAEESMIVA